MDIPVLVYIEIGKVQRNETCGFLMLQRVFHFLADHLDLHVRCLVKAKKHIRNIPKWWLDGDLPAWYKVKTHKEKKHIQDHVQQKLTQRGVFNPKWFPRSKSYQTTRPTMLRWENSFDPRKHLSQSYHISEKHLSFEMVTKKQINQTLQHPFSCHFSPFVSCNSHIIVANKKTLFHLPPKPRSTGGFDQPLFKPKVFLLILSHISSSIWPLHDLLSRDVRSGCWVPQNSEMERDCFKSVLRD